METRERRGNGRGNFPQSNGGGEVRVCDLGRGDQKKRASESVCGEMESPSLMKKAKGNAHAGGSEMEVGCALSFIYFSL